MGSTKRNVRCPDVRIRQDNLVKGSVRKRGSTWTYQFVVVLGGERRFVTRGGFRTRKECEQALSAEMSAAGKGGVTTSRRTLADYLRNEWLPVQETRLKPSTLHGYRLIIEQRIIPLLGSRRLGDLSPGDVTAFLQAHRALPPRRNGSSALSEQTIKRSFRVLHVALAHAVELGLILRNPASLVPRAARPRPKTREMRVWSAADLRMFLEATADDRLHAAYVVAATSGLRRSELAGLRWDDVDLDAGTFSVQRARVEAGYEVFEGPPKSGRGRVVRVPHGTVTALRKHRAAQLEERLAFGSEWIDSGYVLICENGEPLHPQSLTDAFERRVRVVDVPVIRFHDLRHTCATLLLQADVHPKIVQEMLGHSSIAITLDIYSHIVPGMQDEAARRMGAIVFAPV